MGDRGEIASLVQARLSAEQSRTEAEISVRLHNSRRVYNKMKRMGKEQWWQQEGRPGAYYRKFIGEGNFKQLMEDFKHFAESESED